jgi:hypothetical protein
MQGGAAAGEGGATAGGPHAGGPHDTGIVAYYTLLHPTSKEPLQVRCLSLAALTLLYVSLRL